MLAKEDIDGLHDLSDSIGGTTIKVVDKDDQGLAFLLEDLRQMPRSSPYPM